MPTPISATASYCTATQFLARVDVRFVQDLLADAGARLTAQEVASSTTLAALLKEASGWLESACFVSGRYTREDLAALLTNGSEHLVGLVSGVTLWMLWDRRPHKAEQKVPLRAEQAMAQLQLLREGQRIFPLQEHADAGVIESEVEDAATVEARNLITLQAERFFGTRADRRSERG